MPESIFSTPSKYKKSTTRLFGKTMLKSIYVKVDFKESCILSCIFVKNIDNFMRFPGNNQEFLETYSVEIF